MAAYLRLVYSASTPSLGYGEGKMRQDDRAALRKYFENGFSIISQDNGNTIGIRYKTRLLSDEDGIVGFARHYLKGAVPPNDASDNMRILSFFKAAARKGLVTLEAEGKATFGERTIPFLLTELLI